MNSSLSQLMKDTAGMLAQLKPYISADHFASLQRKVSRWQAVAHKASETVPTTPLPPLVRRPQGLPKAVDPLYFNLVKHPYELE